MTFYWLTDAQRPHKTMLLKLALNNTKLLAGFRIKAEFTTHSHPNITTNNSFDFLMNDFFKLPLFTIAPFYSKEKTIYTFLY